MIDPGGSSKQEHNLLIVNMMFLLGNDGQHGIQVSTVNKNDKIELAQTATPPSQSQG